MSVGYRAISWSAHKRLYDAVALAAVVAYLAIFVAVSRLLWGGPAADGGASDEVLVLRATGSCALLLLHIILAIGPLARLDRRFLPLLFNRRHLGVLTFCISAVHAVVATGYYHGFGVINPLLSLLTSNLEVLRAGAFPYQLPGLLALIILFLLAATSHDFWNRCLRPRWWKTLHMCVYLAYALLLAHVALGALQTDRSWLFTGALGAGAVTLALLHLTAGLRERRADKKPVEEVADAAGQWVDAGPVDAIPMDRARTVCAAGERIAVFRHAGGVSAITNVCAHQGGPLGEGAVIDGCVTCPWHGWQYRPADGCAPPPFTERVQTYNVRIVRGRVEVSTRPNAPGTPVQPASDTAQGGTRGH